MERGKSLSIFSFLESELRQERFLELAGWTETQVDDFIAECNVERMADDLKYAVVSGGRFHALLVTDVIGKYIPKLKVQDIDSNSIKKI